MLYFDKWRVVFLYDMMYAVDVFFWLGGFFLGYVMCEERKAKAMGKNPASVFLAILHRLLRIWPCYLLCIAVNSYIIPYIGSGPRWFL
jgi:peptidoglycan/LPS O-acetylase OafA/YrhL